MIDAVRLDRLEDAVLRLRALAMGNLVVVEGRRDVRALDALGVGGEHMTLHRGRSVQHRIDRIARKAGSRTVVLLMDWDRTGGGLQRRLSEGLAGRVRLDTRSRRELALVSHATCVEDVPADLEALRRRVTFM